MIWLLVSAGITLTATAMSWWNNGRTADVDAEITRLNGQHAQLQLADAAARRQLLAGYIDSFARLVAGELAVRKAVEADLTRCLEKSRAVRQRRFGAREGVSLQRATLELELALGRVSAERVHLEALERSLAVDADATTLPDTGSLQLPGNFPRWGACIDGVDGGTLPRSLHGYAVRTLDGEGGDPSRGVVVAVDHVARTVTLSTSRRPLLEANQSDGREPLRAVVQRRDADGIHLHAHGVPLLLHAGRDGAAMALLPEQEVEVYPEVWTLGELCELDSARPLHVRLNPSVHGNRGRWSAIRLAFQQAQLAQLTAAAERLAAFPETDPPWRLHELDSGRLAFSIGDVTLETEPSLASMAFELKAVHLHAEPAPPLSMRVHAELCAFVSGTDDDAELSGSQFVPFLEAIHDELGSLQARTLQQHTALRLRKLSMIYQDQEEHMRTSRSIGVVVTEQKRQGRLLTVLLVGGKTPSWLSASLQAPAGSRLRACHSHAAWDVVSAQWIDPKYGLLTLELAVPPQALLREVAPFEIHRLELANEGSQQQTLSRALERTIQGRFVSTGVHTTLIGLPGETVPNEILGSEAVAQLLTTDTDVVAIWGPPGTGKTTTLVKWLLSIFPEGDESAWPTILMTAPTHVAVTKLLGDLLEKAPWLEAGSVRYAGVERIQGSGLEAIWHQALINALDPGTRGLVTDEGAGARWITVLRTPEGRQAASRWLLGSRYVHAVTCVGIARRDHALWDRSFDIAIIDETGKAFGAELMIPCSVARRVVMVGDHNQLPPTVTSEALDPRIGYRLPFDEVKDLLARNSFQDIFEQLPAHKKGMLTQQHRMHADIGDLVGHLFYEGRLTSSRHGGRWRLTRRRLMFLDFSCVRDYRHVQPEGSSSQENVTEREALLALLYRLSMRNRMQVRRALVICPYEAQRQAVQHALQGTRQTFSVEVTTVDAVQGGEADAVILMMTRSHGGVQFLLDRHRLNVALSRAREAVIVLGHRQALSPRRGGPVHALIEEGERRGTLKCVEVQSDDPGWRRLADWVVP
ncbi:DEAD/DEAH box helicase [Variovorax sp. PAMC26660]|uniref:DEAD/DEAH box helicase n=1 Tax=Variovorax sp. PAMC26660 TaxID=2762322 RepID=UPI00164E2B7C|nr:AAA domain-containing protein [Variovorax sp. PAMC26660]QNK68554.1 AAA family ATPase [Variovorax sp. PAMC26660]